jgi:DNA-binding GntR family transcriptional regulator
MSAGTTVSRSVLSDQVKDRLLGAILDGRFPPGSRIVETRAAREFGTSQAPVREALRDLEAVGVVEITPFRGARVRQPSTSELLEAFVVRSELECLGIRLAVPRLDEADLDALQSDFDLMRRAAAVRDVHAEAAADTAFHGRLVELAGNATLVQVWRRLEPSSRTYITLMASADRLAIADLHGPILDALRRRDVDLAMEAVRCHFIEVEAMLRASLATDGTADAATPDARPAKRPAAHRPVRRRRRIRPPRPAAGDGLPTMPLAPKP